MFYLDPQRTMTQRGSSLVLDMSSDDSFDMDHKPPQTALTRRALTSAPAFPDDYRPPGTVREELITAMFETMLDQYVESWESLEAPKPHRTNKELHHSNKGQHYTEVNAHFRPLSHAAETKKKKHHAPSSKLHGKQSKAKMSHSTLTVLSLMDATSSPRSKISGDTPSQRGSERKSLEAICWWLGNDEKAVIKFANGNVYEGWLSKKLMHGEGRYQWTDGTVFFGKFANNKMVRGKIEFPNGSWYEGEFFENVRHGRGLYVDSRTQRYYYGDWYLGVKEGNGLMCYSQDNYYNGEFSNNLPHGSGVREYCKKSVYVGKWEKGHRQGPGLAIWPNHDYYRGSWKNGLMHSCGLYIWNAFCNDSMSQQALTMYFGHWRKAKREGMGFLYLGFDMGLQYQGSFTENLKDGPGALLLTNGYMLNNHNLFDLDLFGEMSDEMIEEDNLFGLHAPYEFRLIDNTVGIQYYLNKSLSTIYRKDLRQIIIDDYLHNNKMLESKSEATTVNSTNFIAQKCNDYLDYEEYAMQNMLRRYNKLLWDIYLQYASICDTDENTPSNPILCRLYLWQLFFDMDVHEKGVTLVELDTLIFENKRCLFKHPHCPFERLYYWQFINCLLTAAIRLYGRRDPPGPQPNTVIASAFDEFMFFDVLPAISGRKGYLTQDLGKYIPLKKTYELYRSIGDPHTIRQFVCAISKFSTHADLKETLDECLQIGHNYFNLENDMRYCFDKNFLEPPQDNIKDETEHLPLFNLGNLSNDDIIKIFSRIFPMSCCEGVVLDLDIRINFYEFFEALVSCSLASIVHSEEEMSLTDSLSRTPRIR